MTIINNKSEKFLAQYLNNASPTGFESEGQKLWLEYIKPYVDEVDLDNYGTAYGVINPGKDYKVVIEGHADEISWFVNYISDKGFINVIRNGGTDHHIAPGKRVNIHTDKGIVRGVFGWPAIHTRRGKEGAALNPKIENIFIDVGAKDKEEVLKIINMASTQLEPTALANDLSKGVFEITAQLQVQPTDLYQLDATHRLRFLVDHRGPQA